MLNQRRRLIKNNKKQRRRHMVFRPVPNNRIKLVFFILSLGLFGLIGRMAWLQVMQAPELQARARASQTSKTKPIGRRRSIVDRTGRLVALDEVRFRIWAHPRYFNFPGDPPSLVRSPAEVARKLSLVLSIPYERIISPLGGGPSGIKLLEDVHPDLAPKIRSLGISGIDLEPYPQRVYPMGASFANVVGFLNQERSPQAGLEQSQDENLITKEPVKIMRRGADGTPLPDDLAPGTFKDDDYRLFLTLDARLQELAVKSLTAQVKRWKAKKGAAIVMNVLNGELLALASTPGYDPNTYWQFSHEYFKEWSVQDLFEPGSTFKPINLAIALQEGVIKDSQTINDTGKLEVGGWSIYNHDRKANGVIDLAKILQVSSNVGMVKIMRNLDSSRYWDWLKRLGIDMKPDTDLPGAMAGQLKSKDIFTLRPIESATASYGQGFSLTPLKLAQLHSLIANGGYLVKPHIMKGLSSSLLSGPAVSDKINSIKLLKSEVTQTVLEGMESVVEFGSGRGVRTPGYRIGGKTGTAQKVVNGSYQNGAKICSFVANLPVDNPKYVVLVVIDEPKGQYAYGSTVAVPVAKQIIDGLLVLEKIPPSNDQKIFQAAKG